MDELRQVRVCRRNGSVWWGEAPDAAREDARPTSSGTNRKSTKAAGNGPVVTSGAGRLIVEPILAGHAFAGAACCCPCLQVRGGLDEITAPGLAVEIDTPASIRLPRHSVKDGCGRIGKQYLIFERADVMCCALRNGESERVLVSHAT